MRDQHEPLWLPPGSVRAVLALDVVGAYVTGLVEAKCDDRFQVSVFRKT